MKALLLSFLFLLSAPAPFDNNLFSEVAQAIRTGNASQVAQFFNANIDFSMMGKEDMYSKNQARQILKEFFDKHPPKSFVMKHKGQQSHASHYGVGTYVDVHDRVFKIYFLIKRIGNQSLIQQFSIEHDH